MTTPVKSKVIKIEPEIVTNFPDIIGESPAYDASNRRLLWVDTARGQVHELMWGEDSTHRLGRTWQVASWATAVVPRASGGFIVATNRDIVAVSDDGPNYDKTYPPESTVLASLPNQGRPRWRDLSCDPQGRLIGGWVPDDHSGPGEVVRLDSDGSFTTILSGVGLMGGCDWSPDGRTFYLCDSYVLTVYAFDYNGLSGTVENRRTAITIEPGAGIPIGLTVDSEGCIWLAILYSGETRRYSPKGALLAAIRMPTMTPVACAFGGPDSGELFITSCWLKHAPAVLQRIGISNERAKAASRDKVGGALFVCRTGFSGRPATPFAG